MVREGEVVAGQLVERTVEASPRHDGRGLLFERSRGGIARIGEELFAVGLALGVQAVERGVGHEDLAPDLEVLGPPRAAQPQRYGTYRADVGRDVVARDAVAARHGACQRSVVVGERDGRAVEFQFADEIRRSDLAFDAFDEFVEFVGRVGVSEREHRVAVAHGGEFRGEVAADAHRRGVGVGIFGMSAFQVLEFAHHRVELEVRDFGCVFDVVFEIMQFELAAQLLDSFAYHNITIACVKLHILVVTTGKNKKNAKKNCRCGAIFKFCV